MGTYFPHSGHAQFLGSSDCHWALHHSSEKEVSDTHISQLRFVPVLYTEWRALREQNLNRAHDRMVRRFCFIEDIKLKLFPYSAICCSKSPNSLFSSDKNVVCAPSNLSCATPVAPFLCFSIRISAIPSRSE